MIQSFFVAVCPSHGHRLIDVVSINVLVSYCCSMLVFVIIVIADPSCLCRANGSTSNGQGSVSLNATASKEPWASVWKS